MWGQRRNRLQSACYKANNLTTVTDPRRLVTTYGYAGLDKPFTLVSPDTGTTIRALDTAGNVLTSTDARGALATYRQPFR